MAETKVEEKWGLEEKGASEEKGHEGVDVSAIAKIGLAETLDHEFLFDRDFQVETDGTGKDGEEAADESILQRRTEKRDQEAGVDGMPHETIRAGHDQRVVLFEGRKVAPVFSED